jgi:hypothetical protein
MNDEWLQATLNQGMQKVECKIQELGSKLHIPTVVGHPFRFISDSHSNSKRTPVPIDIGQ